MSILGHRGFLLKPAGSPGGGGGGHTYVGYSQAQVAGGSALSYPAGTVAGDLVVYFSFGGNGESKAGWTYHSGATDQYGYVYNGYSKIAGAETTVNAVSNTNSNYPQIIVTLRGPVAVTQVATAINLNSGNSAVATMTGAGSSIALLLDRGAGGSPTVTSSSTVTTTNFSGTYFAIAVSRVLNRVAGTTITVTDRNDTYGSSAIFFSMN